MQAVTAGKIFNSLGKCSAFPLPGSLLPPAKVFPPTVVVIIPPPPPPQPLEFELLFVVETEAPIIFISAGFGGDGVVELLPGAGTPILLAFSIVEGIRGIITGDSGPFVLVIL